MVVTAWEQSHLRAMSGRHRRSRPHRLSHVVVQPVCVWLLQAWPEAEWKLIHDAGHSAYEPGVQAALLAATDKFATTA